MKILDYVTGSREGQDANALEKEAITDSFLTDAIDGYDAFPHNNPTDQIEHIKERIGHRRILSRRSRLGSILLAMIAFFIIGGGYFLLKNKEYLSVFYQLKQYTTAKIDVNLEQDVQENILETAKFSESIVAVDSLKVDTLTINTISERVAEAFNNKNSMIDNASLTIKSDTGIKAVSPKAKDNVDISINTAQNKETPRSISTKKPEKASTESYNTESNANGIKEAKGTSANKKKTDVDFTIQKNESVDKESESEISLVKKTEAEPSKSETSSEENKDITSKELPVIPEPIIGFTKYKQYLKASMKIPDSEDCKSIKGTVELEFTIAENGKPTGIKVVKSLCTALDNEAIRLLENGSDWTVAKQKASLKVQF